jgi:predicted Zn-dependent protease
LIDAGQAGRAHRLLLDLLNNVPPTPEQIRLIARAANEEGDTLNAYYYMGEYYVSTGNLPLAIRQLRMALRVPDAGPVEQAKLNARLAELMDYLPKEQRAEVANTGPQGP